MIRFCDREVGCVEYDLLNRRELLSYFLSGHINDTIMVYDSLDNMRYVGNITYYSLLYAINVNSAIQEEYLVLNQDIWKNAREYFSKKRRRDGEVLIIPVVNEEHQVICFAYEDDDANREIRMLRELSEHPEALQFEDMFPEYQCVRIYEFNELAYFFAKYLESRNVPVQVQGVMWQNLFAGGECEVPDYACLTIYAEGIAGKKQNLIENVLRSVSVEFECIDKIYEANIKNGVFRNAEGNWEELAERLRGEKEIVIIGIGVEAQRTYGFLRKSGINVCCFMGDGRWHKMFGKKILNRLAIQSTLKSPVYIECIAKGSAWGIGNTDYYDYVGYERNKQYILLRDYVEVPDDSAIYAVRDRKTFLIGDLYLCRYLSEYLIQNGITVSGCLGMLPKDDVFEEVSGRQIDYKDRDITWLIVVPVVYGKNKDMTWQKEKEQVTAYCWEKGIDDYADCFSYLETYINVEKRSISMTKQLSPKRIVIGAIESHCGNAFFRGVLDSHPSVMMIADYVQLNNNLFWICVSLSMVDAGNILSVFWNVYGSTAAAAIYNKELFNEKMEQLLEHEDRLTSQQLFVMFHIAYMYMDGKDITEPGISSMIIYWEPHSISRRYVEDFVKWLSGDRNIVCSIVNVVRNCCMQTGSMVKECYAKKMLTTRSNILRPYTLDKKEYDGVDRLIVRFEDIKCEPESTLLAICKQWGIPWSESLMTTTRHGKKSAYFNGERLVSDFDLKPVYDTYEKYLTEFDRLRIMIFSGPWQKKYGYPYVTLLQFSRRELQEMFLMKYRVEDLTESYKVDEKSIGMQKRIRDWLQVVRMQEVMQERGILEKEEV